MTDGNVHGTDCFEVDSFLQKNELSKLYHVRHKETSMFYTMEVSPRDSSSKAPISPYVQQPTTRFSPFLVNLRFTFQTRSKFYYILDFPGKETLSQHAKSFGGTFPEPQARFYAAEILIALEELHNFGLAYNELSLDTVCVEPSGHVMLWRNFCGKFYWSKRECVCSLHGFSHGDPCNNNHEPKSDFDFQEDWRTFGSVLYTMLTGKNSPGCVTNDRSLSVSASDLISRLVRGEVCRSEQIQSHPFFKGVNWNEVKKKETQPPMGSDSELIRSQTSPSPSYSSVRADVPTGPSSCRPQSTLHQRDSPLGANFDYVPESYRPRTLSRHSDPSISTYGESGPFSPLRPHSLSHNSDPGDSGYVKSAPNFMAPGRGLHHAISTPDLRTSGQEFSMMKYHHSYPANDVNYHHGYPDQYDSRAGAYPPTPHREVEGRHLLTSRSLSDLSSLGYDAGYGSQSPTTIQRSFAYPSYEGDPRYREMFYLQSDSASPRIYNGEYRLHSAGSVPDLTTSSPQFSPPYFNPRNGRASPTPSQYSDYSSFSAYTASPSPPPRDACFSPRSRLSENGFSLNESGYGTRGNESALSFTGCDQNSSREFEYLRYNAEISSGCRRGESPSPSTPQRFFGYSSPQNIVPPYKAKTQNNSLQGLDPTTKTDSSRSSTVGGRERPSLIRAMSLSNLGKQAKQLITEEVSEKRRDSLPLSVGSPREKYPLARVPIPSFREFKQKNLERYSKNIRVDENAHAKEVGLRKTPKTVKHESKSDTDGRSSLKERLSSLYESAKDISAQNTTKRLSITNKMDSSVGEGYKLNSSGNRRIDKNIAKSGESIEPKHDSSKETKISRKISRGRQESPFSKNEVIHQLMLKYGLYEKGGQKKSRSPKDERKAISSGNISLDGKERGNDEKEPRRLSSDGKGKLLEERETNWLGATDQSTGSALVDRPVSSRKTTQGITGEARKSAAERFRELRRKNGICKDVSEAFLDGAGVTSRVKSTESSSIDRTVVENYGDTKASHKNDLESIADRAQSLALKSNSAKDEICASNSEPINAKPDSSNVTKNSFSLRGTSRAILCASKFKRAANKELSTTKDSPLPDRKQLSEIIGKTEETTKHKNQETEKNSANSPTNLMDVKRNRSFDRASPRARRRRFQEDRGLRKGGIHTSMLSVASSACSDTEVDDTVSICSEMDDERGSRSRRWESFHSNMSADSGSAHMFEFETDSNITEYDEVFDCQDSEDDHPKFEVDVERTDSGVGGDMGQSPLRRSWEEIMMKSSEHWSIVAASARHWQELARRKKANENEPSTTPRKKSSTHSITEDMVECPDCLKHYVPPEEESNASEPQICAKCKDRKVERKEAIIELVQTEINYGNDLQILKEEFYLPMQSGGILSPENLAAIFLNLQELLEVNSKFCAKLQKSLEDSVANGDEEFSDVNVGSIFLESVDFFQAYEIYCSKQTAASALLESLQKKTELLRIFLNVTCRENPKCRKMDLNSFILAPVQRIMKYPLLLSRICKATPRRNTDREKLKVAQRKIEEQLNKINALNTTVESRQKRYRASQQLGRSDSLDKLQMKKMASDILNWTMEEMQLLMHGVFQVTIHEFGAAWNRRNSKKALSVCALFCVRGHSESLRIDSDDEGQCDELLFPGEGEVTDAAVVLLRKKISGKYTLFKDPLFLDMCVIYRDSELKDAFEVLSVGKESYVFRASTSREYRRWLKYLRLESKELGAWKRRRNGLPNIMIKNL